MAITYKKVPQMKVLFVISALVSIASAGVGPIVIIPSTSALIRSPQRDSAIIQSERLGGNFAYAIAEGQSFQTVSPILASNIRAIDNLGVSYAINPFPILTAPATILLQHPTSEEQQREHQKQQDLLQKQRDELQEAFDATQEAIGRQHEEDERQLREQIEQQNELNLQAIEQQKQLIELQRQWQQDQQTILTNGGGIVTVPIVPIASGPSLVQQPIGTIGVASPINPINTVNNDNNGSAENNGDGNGSDNNNNNTNNNHDQGTDPVTSDDSDSVVVENPTLSKDSNSDEQTQTAAEDQPIEGQLANNN